MYTISRTDSAHVSPSASDFRVVSRPKTTRGALRVMRRLARAQRAGGSGSWAFNLRCVGPNGELWTVDDLETATM